MDGGPSVIVMLKAWLVNWPPTYVARMLPANVPSVVGVPLITPEDELIDRPGGSVAPGLVNVTSELQAATFTLKL